MQPKLSDFQSVSINLEIAQLLQKGVIQPCYHEAGEFISPVFTRPKKDGSFRMILNLKVRISSDRDDRRIFLGLKFPIPGFFFGWLDLSRDFLGCSRRSEESW